MRNLTPELTRRARRIDVAATFHGRVGRAVSVHASAGRMQRAWHKRLRLTPEKFGYRWCPTQERISRSRRLARLAQSVGLWTERTWTDQFWQMRMEEVQLRLQRRNGLAIRTQEGRLLQRQKRARKWLISRLTWALTTIRLWNEGRSQPPGATPKDEEA